MKKFIKNIAIAVLSVVAITGCQDDDHTFGAINTPEGLEVEALIVGQDAGENPFGDGSGLVNFTAKANNAVSYKYVFSDGTSANSPNGILEKRFTINGTNTYTVTVIASGTAGIMTTISFDITVFSNFRDDDAVAFLTGGSSKKWYWAADELGHLGVGANNDNVEQNFNSGYYSATPFEKAGAPESSCLYDNELTFSLVDGILKYELDNGGNTFYNGAYHTFGGGDLCLPLDTSGQKTVLLSPSESILMTTNPDKTRGTAMTFADGGFMGYFIGQSTYEILSITENRMVVRAVMGNDPALAWYHIFTTTKPVQGGGGDNFTNLVWSDDFDVDGAPNPANWSYDLGQGTNGWGNQEVQNYTSDTDNVIVEGGFLKITAKKEPSGGAQYSSARIKSENNFEFTYGKVEVRAKLPSGGGTWPALWMLGANYDQPGFDWPACGEIDIMEHKGNEPNVIHGTLHYPGNSGGNANGATTTVANVSSEFHVYSVTWSPSSIKFYVDDNLYHSYQNVSASPYNLDFFLIMNIAMGGTFGGAIDPLFTQSTMEVDYIKVYQ